MQEEMARKDREILELKAKMNGSLLISWQETIRNFELTARLENAEVAKTAVAEAIKAIEKERDDLANDVRNKEMEKQLLEKSLKEKFLSELKTKDDIIKLKDEEIALRKDMKLKLSTKMLGETLEKHCEVEFDSCVLPDFRTPISRRTQIRARKQG